jgi:hypothetical protein
MNLQSLSVLMQILRFLKQKFLKSFKKWRFEPKV